MNNSEKDINELQTFTTYLLSIFLGTIIFQYLYCQETTNYLIAQILTILQLEKLSHEYQSYLRVLIDLCYLLDYTQYCLKLLCVLQHSNEDCFEVVFQEILRLLSCFMLPLYYLMPYWTTKLNNLNDKIQNCFSFRGHNQWHCLQFILRLFLSNFQHDFRNLTPLFYHFNHHNQCFLHTDPQKCLYVNSIRRNRKVILKNNE